MNTRKPKTLDDFPKFHVAGVRRGETSAEGYTRFELVGRFDTVVEGIDSGWFWLLTRPNKCLCANLTSLEKQSGEALLSCDEKEEPIVAGQTLFYLSPYWQAFHVWMVLDPDWGWKRTRFEGTDAVAEDYLAPDVSIVDGREVRIWTNLERTDRAGRQSRYYPADDQDAPPNLNPRVVPGGWGHEHCELRKEHIDAGQLGYRDPDGRWVCEKCYDRYVVPRDLSFVDEL